MKKQNFCDCGKAISRTAHKCKSCAMLGNRHLIGYVPTAETRAKLSASHRGRVHSEETKRKLAAARMGAQNPNWQGGRSNERGYPKIFLPAHREADYNGYVRIHRLIMEEMIGRALRPGEIVHHLDGDRQNNDPKNLSLCADRKEHAQFHRPKWLTEEASNG